jgi:hypothetical protein
MSGRLPLVLAAAVLALLPAAAAALPWPPRQPPVGGLVANADARVGDWVSHRAAGPDGVTRRQTVVTRGAGWVTVREEYPGSEVPPVEYTVRMAGAGPAVAAAMAADDGPVVEVLATGRETPTVGGVKYECEWTKTKVTIPGRASLTRYVEPVEVTRTRWVCKDVPGAGAGRTEVRLDGHTSRWEVTGHGRGK